MTLATVCVRSLEVTVEKAEGCRVPVMTLSDQEKLDSWKLPENEFLKEDNQDRNTWPTLIPDNHMSNSYLLEARLGLRIRPTIILN